MGSTARFAAAALLVFIGLAAASAARKSATVDEFAHLAAGLYAWKTFDFSLYAKTPPTARMLATAPALLFRPAVPTDLTRFRSLSWLPWTYATYFQLQNIAAYGRILLAARLTVIFMGAVLCLLIFLGSRARYGDLGGLVSLAACALSPTILAHARLVTTDLPAALFSFVFLLLLLQYRRRPSAPRALALAAAAAMAVLTKFSLLFFAPLLFLAPPLALARVRAERARPGPRAGRGPVLGPGRAGAHLLIAAVALWVFILAGYGGQGVGFQTAASQSRSLGRVAPALALLPLPRDFVHGLDLQLADAERGEWRQGNYLLGHWYGGGHWYYYPLALAAKEPVPYLALFAVALGLILKGPRRFDEVFLLAVIAAYFAVASLFGSLQIGLRYLLPLYPPAFMLLGRLGEYIQGAEPAGARRRLAPRAALAAACIWAAAANLCIWPDYLAYFSPLAGGPDRGRFILLDSNLDWGQDLPGLARWMRDHKIESLDLAYFGHDNPARFGIRFTLPGRGSGARYLAVSANLLMGRDYPMTFLPRGVTKSDPLFFEVARFRDKKSVAVIGHTIYVFDRRGAGP